ncbi:MAG: hypothetical protein J2P28_16525 [Actinobacteria bacterium]|nr:hypothetical protein [Actinomycetota bacterium]MBO0837096.1 hypothetical protein [Actinomycetota bacterium]
MHDTWTNRDLPVLDATVALLEQSFMVTVTDIADRTGMEPATVATALEALDPVYVDFRKTETGGDPRFWYVYKATPEARRAVGQWPSAEALATRLAEELAAEAAHEADSERLGLLIYAARLVGETLRDATVRAARRVLAPAFGGVPVPELGNPVPESQRRPAPEPELTPVPEPELTPVPEPELTPVPEPESRPAAEPHTRQFPEAELRRVSRAEPPREHEPDEAAAP